MAPSVWTPRPPPPRPPPQPPSSSRRTSTDAPPSYAQAVRRSLPASAIPRGRNAPPPPPPPSSRTSNHVLPPPPSYARSVASRTASVASSCILRTEMAMRHVITQETTVVTDRTEAVAWSSSHDRPNVAPPPYSVAATSTAAPSTGRAIREVLFTDPHDALGISAPVELFSADYEKESGKLLHISPTRPPTEPSKPKRSEPMTEPSPSSTAAPAKRPATRAVRKSPRPLMDNRNSSPARRGMGLLASAAGIVTGARPSNIVPPPTIVRGTSPTPLADVFETPQPRSTSKGKGGKGGKAWCGLVPKSGFIHWARPGVFPRKNDDGTIQSVDVPRYSDKQITADLKTRRFWMHQDFYKSATTGSMVDIPPDDRRITRSSVEDDDDWILDDEAFNMETTDRRRLSRVPLEHMAIAAPKTSFLMLVDVNADYKILRGQGSRVDREQNHPRTFISGREFLTLKCEIKESRFRDLILTGETSKLYNDRRFENDFKAGNGGFSLSVLRKESVVLKDLL
jgi:hypothetical protein